MFDRHVKLDRCYLDVDSDVRTGGGAEREREREREREGGGRGRELVAAQKARDQRSDHGAMRRSRLILRDTRMRAASRHIKRAETRRRSACCARSAEACKCLFLPACKFARLVNVYTVISSVNHGC